ncbi:TadE/TadG family type IV pilus assembly protein [Intrasporangium sp.]|uniref:TadE/TadG family type IV pilus assembly protein n=1 Tax=Intrasporangium sp. TaxID=1925024 RepID=UPI0032217863
MVRLNHAGRRRTRGAAAVEFALVLPLMLAVIGGVVDFGRAFYTQVVLTNAAREGARAAVVLQPYDASAVTQRARAAAPGITPADLTVTTPGACAAGSNAAVSVSTGFTWLVLEPALSLVGAGSALPTSLSAKAVMQCGG